MPDGYNGSMNIEDFTSWFLSATKQSESFAFAELAPNIAGLIGSTCSVVLFSGENAVKQRDKHPDLSIDVYQMIAENISQPDALVRKDNGHKLVFFFIAEKWYEAIIKTTRDKSEVYLVSIYRSDERKLWKEAAKGELVYDGRK